MTTKISGLSSIISNYDTFLIDAWGVLHNGRELFPEVPNAINGLIEANKQVVILSNSPRSIKETKTKLTKLGLGTKGLDIVTSGEFFKQDLNQNHIFKAKKNSKAYVFGAELNEFITTEVGKKYQVTSDYQSADFYVMCWYDDDSANYERYRRQLEEVASNFNKPMLCPNPDVTAPLGSRLVNTPGFFAEIFENLGGEVYYYGKPYKPIYDYALAKMTSTPKNRIIAIGDNLATDIRGAQNFEIASVLVLTGIHANDNLDPLYTNFSCKPHFLINSLSW